MSDLERLLSDALRSAGRDYSPSDELGARGRFVTLRRRRRAVYAAAATVAVAAVVIAVIATGDRSVVRDSAPVPPAGTATATAAPTATATAAPGQRAPIFVFAADGDISAVFRSGVITRLTDTPEIEANPAVAPDGSAVVFERRRDAGARPELVYMDLDTGSECCFRPGAYPAFAVDGEVASVLPDGGVGFGFPTSERQLTGLESGPLTTGIRHLAWDQSNQVLYYESHTGASPALVRADAIVNKDQVVTRIVGPQEIALPGDPPGTAYLAPSAIPLDVMVVKLCCGPGYDHAELGQLELPDGGWSYQKVVDLEGLGLDLTDPDLFVAGLGQWSVGSGAPGAPWHHVDGHAWLVGDGTHAWFVGWNGRIVELPFEITGGASAPVDQDVIDNLDAPS